MQQKSNARNLYLKVFALSIFIFARSFVFIEENRIGFNMTESDVSITVWNLMVLVLLFFAALLIVVVLFGIDNRCNNEAQYICALMIADPVFFLFQNNGLKLISVVLGLFFIFNKMRNKTSAINEVLLCLCLFLSAFLMPYSVFCFASLIIAVNFISEIDRFFEDKKQILSLVFNIICVIGGLVWNKLIFPKAIAFENFLITFSFYDYSSVMKNSLIFLVGIPTAVFGIYFFFRCCMDAKKGNGKIRAFLVFGIVILAYVLLIIGYMMNGMKSLYTINLIVPSAILALMLSKDENACAQMKKINIFIQNHMFLMLILFIIYNCVSILIMRNAYYVKNIVSNII